MAGADGMTALTLRIEEVHHQAQQSAAANDARQETHEKVCAERYKSFIEKIEGVGAQIATLSRRFDGDAAQRSATAWGLNWKAWCLIGTVLVLAVSGMAWMAGQLYALEPLRLQAEAGNGPH